MKAPLILLAALCLLLPATLRAQVSKERDVVASGGEFASSATMSLSWTAGEVAIASASTSNLIVSEGFQQGDQNMVGIDQNSFEGEITVFPNPVQDQLSFEVRSEKPLSLQAELYDLRGKLVRSVPSFRVLQEYAGKIDFSDLPAGKWLLRFHNADGSMGKTFSVLKIN